MRIAVSPLLSTFLFTLIAWTGAHGATITAIASGTWTSNSTWSCGCQPTNADNIIIPAGITVTSNGPAILFLGPVITITVYGTLVLNNASLQVDSSDIIAIKTGGKITGTGILGGSVYSGVIPMFVPNGSSIVGPKTISNGTLPVKLTSFEAEIIGDGVVLRWITASEIKLDHYELLRSSDGIRFKTIGVVPAAGNSSQRTDYAFRDETPLIRNYYQLLSVDADSSSSRSAIISVETNQVPVVEIFPNPVTGSQFFARVNFVPDTAAEVVLYNGQGMEISRSRIAQLSEADVFSFSAPTDKGIYFMILTSKSSVFRNRIIIQ